MDPRIREHAEVVIEHSTKIESGDNVIISGSQLADDLVVALYELCGERGANPMRMGAGDRAMRAYLNAADPESFDLPDHAMAATEATDVFIGIIGTANASERSDVDPQTTSAYKQATKPIADERIGKRWVATQFPTPGNAQKAEMSTEAYEDFVWDAINKDWDAQREHQAQLVEILDPASEVHIKSGDTTDLTMSIDGMKTVNDYAEKNLPGGEVFTAPIPDSVEGAVLFDMPLNVQGREIRNARLVFEDGDVSEHSAETNEDVLTSLLDTDDGARRLGELGIGMNRDIDQFTHNMLFDEKMGDTVHMAIGRAIEECVPDGQPLNESAVHTDMIVDMSEESFIAVDGEVVQRDGTFVFEDEFEN
ncbi:aminopeptidase [Halocatena marina]|uniref:Aminopeptidase n=1 Tax=Halocatena marina TaxID=2934937 RepID=A0ABD5YV11_9EURY|nr:aminopeptidase [Halocatena marina]